MMFPTPWDGASTDVADQPRRRAASTQANLGGLAEARVPDSAAAADAERLAHAESSPMLYGHALRSYFFAALLAARDGIDYDQELLYVGCVLHDIGLTPHFADPVRPFEHVSADACAELAERHGWALPRRYRLHRAVVLHMAPTLPPAEDAEVLLLEAGVACDVTGARSQEVSAERSRSCWPAIRGPASSAGSPSSCDTRRPASRSPTRLCSCKGSRNGSPARRSSSEAVV